MSFYLAWLSAAGVLALLGVWLLRRYEVVVRFKTEVPVSLRGTLPLRAAIEQRVDVGIDDEVEAQVKLGSLQLPLDEQLDVPLDLTLQVPIDSDVMIDQPVRLSLMVPIQTVLTEREIDLNQLEIPIGDVFVDDVVDIADVVHIDTQVQTALGITVPVKAAVPIKTKVRIKQALRVVNSVKVRLERLQIPINAQIPVETSVQLRQTFRVRGTVEVPIRQRVIIPVKQTITANLPESVGVSVKLCDKVHAHLKADLAAEVAFDRAIPAQLGAVHIDGEQVRLQAKRAISETRP